MFVILMDTAYSFPDCVNILQDRLQLNNHTNGVTIHETDNSHTPKGKKNPLGFIVDFFRPKKTKNNNHLETGDHSSSVSHSPSSGLTSERTSAEATRSCSTPRKLKNSEVIKSIEKLHVSREDNPAVKSRRNTPTRIGIPTDVEVDDDHSHLIRNSPPTLRHENSPSSTPQMLSPWEKSRRKLENDAAQILAIHRSPGENPISANAFMNK